MVIRVGTGGNPCPDAHRPWLGGCVCQEHHVRIARSNVRLKAEGPRLLGGHRGSWAGLCPQYPLGTPSILRMPPADLSQALVAWPGDGVGYLGTLYGYTEERHTQTHASILVLRNQAGKALSHRQPRLHSETLKNKGGRDLDKPGSSRAVSPAGGPWLRLFSCHTPSICLEGTLHGHAPGLC